MKGGGQDRDPSAQQLGRCNALVCAALSRFLPTAALHAVFDAVIADHSVWFVIITEFSESGPGRRGAGIRIGGVWLEPGGVPELASGFEVS